MRELIDQPFAMGMFAGSIEPGALHGTFVCKLGIILGTADRCIVEPVPANLEGDSFAIAGNGRECIRDTDFAPLKTAADVLLTAILPRLPADKTAMPLRLKVGNLTKQILAVGGRLTDAERTLSYGSAFGGPKFDFNPIGKGSVKGTTPGLIYQDDLKQGFNADTRPAGFLPIAPEWAPRKNKLGTYKKDYVKQRWPWFPADFDWSYFNSAPDDQQVEGYLRGDEDIELANLHPTVPVYRSKLPGVRPRCFVMDHLPDGAERFREAKMNLDTLCLNTIEGKGSLTWRGLLEVQSLKMREIDHVMVISEQMTDQPMTLDEAYRLMRSRIAPPQLAVEVPEPDAAAVDADAEPQPVPEAVETGPDESKEAISKAMELANEQMDKLRQIMVERGMDTSVLENPPEQSPAEIAAAVEKQIPMIAQKSPEMASAVEEAAAFIKMLKMPEDQEPEPDAGERAEPQATRGPHTIFDDQDLTGTDFSDQDLTACSFKRTKLVDCLFLRATVNHCDFSGGDLRGAKFEKANLLAAQFDKAVLEGASFSGASIDFAVFANQNLDGADFTGCRGMAADFSKSSLRRARFQRANLPNSNFSDGDLRNADFSAAVLTDAQFDNVKANSIQLEAATLTGLHGAGGDFSDGRFRKASATGAIFEKAVMNAADFTGAVLERALFSEASVTAGKFAYCQMPYATFDDADLESANFLSANLFKSSFDRANLRHVTFRNANLYGSGFWESRFDQTTADGANLKGTQLV